MNLLRSPHPTPAQLAGLSDNSFAYELTTETLIGDDGSKHSNANECAADTLSAKTAEHRLGDDMGRSMTDQDLGFSSLEPIMERGNNYDIEVIRAYEQLPAELQEAEDEEAAEQAGAGAIVADDDADAMSFETMDAGYESDTATTLSTSVTPSIWNHSFENGRRYHRYREGAYHFPNDDVEQEREDMKHSMVKMLCHHRLHFAPINNSPQEILDMGTGTGAWAIESKISRLTSTPIS